jgi:hypothetical protein
MGRADRAASATTESMTDGRIALLGPSLTTLASDGSRIGLGPIRPARIHDRAL